MIIQSYDVKTSSERTFLSVQSTNMLAVRDINLARARQVAPALQNPPNTQGTQGNQNSQGSQGAQGNQNSQGSQGAQGNQNSQGSQGAQGNQNSQGQDEDMVEIANRGARRRRRGVDSEHFRRFLQELKDESISKLAKYSSSPFISRSRSTKNSLIPKNPHELKTQLLQMMLEQLTGKKTEKSSSWKFESDGNVHNFTKSRSWSFSANVSSTNVFSSIFGGVFGEGAARPERVDGWRVEQFNYESEQVSYSAQGVIHTADGRTINVDINMYMSREFVSYMEIDIESRLLDPIVINYGGNAASLTGDRFQFDLTMDGSLDNLAVLGEGSGFLAVDWNGDGIINDGSELFGPSTGCGFSELRQYDTDGNGWIDSGDEIFDKLVVWHRDKDGNDTVFTLRELGIGAIYLGDIATEFSFKDESNQTLGVMRSTSFFIKECGGAGTVSHIDMSI